MKNDIPMICAYRTDAKASPGLKDLFYGSPEKPFIQVVGHDGNVIGLQEEPPLRPGEFVPIYLPMTAQVGLPFVSAFLQDAANPQSVDVMYWQDMIAKVLSVYPSMSEDLCKNHPKAGMSIANFVLELAPKWAANSSPVDFERFRPEINLIATDEVLSFRNAPEIVALAKATDVDLKRTRRHEMLP